MADGWPIAHGPWPIAMGGVRACVRRTTDDGRRACVCVCMRACVRAWCGAQVCVTIATEEGTAGGNTARRDCDAEREDGEPTLDEMQREAGVV
jgi:hypothetical protein